MTPPPSSPFSWKHHISSIDSPPGVGRFSLINLSLRVLTGDAGGSRVWREARCYLCVLINPLWMSCGVPPVKSTITSASQSIHRIVRMSAGWAREMIEANYRATMAPTIHSFTFRFETENRSLNYKLITKASERSHKHHSKVYFFIIVIVVCILSWFLTMFYSSFFRSRKRNARVLHFLTVYLFVCYTWCSCH